jgi:hypothetical protein
LDRNIEVKQFNVKLFIPETGLLHSEFNVFASDAEAAVEEALAQEKVLSGSRVLDPRFSPAVTEVE